MELDNLKDLYGDDGIPAMNFYRKLDKIAKKVTLRDAEAAISVLPDSDVEDDESVPNQIDIEEEVELYIEEDDDVDDERGNVETDDEDNIQLSVLAEKLRPKAKTTRKNVTWERDEFSPPQIVFHLSENNDENAVTNQTPLMYFSKYFPDEIFKELSEKTNVYSIQKNGKNINTSESEIRKLVAFHILMGIVRFPRLRMYWTPATRIRFVDNIHLSRNRFESIRNNINEDHNSSDKLWKVRPVVDSFEKRCEDLRIEENLCIDESIIPFKGQLAVKQYLKGKPNPWGVKLYMLCGASGIIYRSVIYQGSTTLPIDIQERYSATNGLVTLLSNRIPEHEGHKLFCDNYFTSLLLLQELLEKGIFVAGTVRANRLEKCPLKSESELKKTGRGSCDHLVTEDKKIVAVRWFDNKVVNLASNFVGVEPEDEVRRWDRKEGKFVMVKCPAIIRLYNLSMGGVDKSDFLIALYRRKWTLRVIFHYFNLGVCNSWLEYQADMARDGVSKKSRMDLLQFTMSVVEGLASSDCLVNTSKRGRPLSGSPSNSPVSVKHQKPLTVPLNDVRFDNLGHWPVHVDGHEQHCKLETCEGRSRIQCEKCHVPLCLSKLRNCFKKFHCNSHSSSGNQLNFSQRVTGGC